MLAQFAFAFDLLVLNRLRLFYKRLAYSQSVQGWRGRPKWFPQPQAMFTNNTISFDERMVDLRYLRCGLILNYVPLALASVGKAFILFNSFDSSGAEYQTIGGEKSCQNAKAMLQTAASLNAPE